MEQTSEDALWWVSRFYADRKKDFRTKGQLRNQNKAEQFNVTKGLWEPPPLLTKKEDQEEH